MIIKPTSYESITINIAKLIATRSTCPRLQVGCVLVSNDYKQLSWGFNGNDYSSCKNTEPSMCAHRHAEPTCMDECLISCNVLYMFVTHLPCIDCANQIIRYPRKITKIYFEKYHREQLALPLFKAANIEVYNITNENGIERIV